MALRGSAARYHMELLEGERKEAERRQVSPYYNVTLGHQNPSRERSGDGHLCDVQHTHNHTHTHTRISDHERKIWEGKVNS